MKKIIFFIAMICSSSVFAFPTGPVMVGGDAEFDACGGYGLVTVSTVLYSQEKSGQVVFSKIDAAQGVFMCDSKIVDGVEYLGVVFSTNENESCGVGTPIENKEAYSGNCKSGWVKAEYVTLIAG